MRADADARMPGPLATVLGDVARERDAQDAMWGVQEFPDGTGREYAADADEAKAACRTAWSEGRLTWRHILTEEFFEALAESDPERLRVELVQTAAVAVKWVQALDRRHGRVPHLLEQGGGRPEKLVRDRIPAIIEADGRAPEVRAAGEAEYAALLIAKLYEEAGEYTADRSPGELADLLEVVHALARTHGLDPAGLEELRAAKAAERGGFADRLVLRMPARPRDATGPVTRRSVRAILLDGDEVVLLRRTMAGREPYWTTPGGRVEPEDPSLEAALRRELDEELGATVGEPREVFAFAEHTPGLQYLHTFYVCRLGSMDLSRRHGPEFTEPGRGRYDVERVPLTAEAIGAIDLVPGPLAEYLRASATRLRSGSP